MLALAKDTALKEERN